MRMIGDFPAPSEVQGEPSPLLGTEGPSSIRFSVQQSFLRLKAMCASLVVGQTTIDEHQSLMET